MNDGANSLLNIELLAKQVAQDTGLTAVGIGVARGQESPQIATHGHRRRRGSATVSTKDRWHIGSVGKSITATLIAKLFEKEFPRLDCPIVELAPELNVHRTWQDCTLYHLLTSTSGLPANFPMSILKIKEEDPARLMRVRRDLIADAMAKPAKFKCGDNFQYSNLGYTVLGYIAEAYTGKAFQDLVTEHVLDPLELTSAGFGAPCSQLPDSEPLGHRVFLGFRISIDPAKVVADNPAVIAPAGRLHMTLADLLRYGRAHLNGHLHNNRFLRSETWDLLHTPFLENYACGWVAFDPKRGNSEMIWHNGSNTLWYTLLILVPSKELVLAFVTNDGAIKRAESKFFDLADHIIAAS